MRDALGFLVLLAFLLAVPGGLFALWWFTDREKRPPQPERNGGNDG